MYWNYTSVQWHYAGTGINPGDAASRGLAEYQFVHNSCWLKDPRFLWSLNVHSVALNYKPGSLNSQDPQVKKASTRVTRTMNKYSNHFEISRLISFFDESQDCSGTMFATKDSPKGENLSSQVLESKLREVPMFHHQKPKTYLKQRSKSFAVCSKSTFRRKSKPSLHANEEFLSWETVKQRYSTWKKTNCLYRLDPMESCESELLISVSVDAIIGNQAFQNERCHICFSLGLDKVETGYYLLME